MKRSSAGAILAAALLFAQPATAALVTLTFDGQIGPLASPATLMGGNFDGTISFDDARPFARLPATLAVLNGPLAGTYNFGARPGAFVATTYQAMFSNTAFNFRGTSDDNASVTFNLTGTGDAYSGSFAFTKNSGISAVGDVTIGAAAAAVPEPATWLAMTLGFGLIGGVLRARRRTLAVSSGSAFDGRPRSLS